MSTSDPENTFLSFSNPNYQFEDQLRMKSSKLRKDAYHNDSNIYDEEDVTSISLLDNKSVSEKYSNNGEKQRLLDELSADSSSEEEEESECENKDLKENTWKNKKNLMEKGDRMSQEVSAGTGKKYTGFLDYYSMLESKAKEKSQSVSSDLDLELEWSGITSPVSQTKVKLVSQQFISFGQCRFIALFICTKGWNFKILLLYPPLKKEGAYSFASVFLSFCRPSLVHSISK